MKLNLVCEEQIGGARNTEVLAFSSLQASLQAGRLDLDFEVTTSVLHVNPKLAKDKSQWGLWDWDAVEVFVAANPTSQTYHEFIVSPLGQYFELQIFEPRKRFDKGFSSGFSYEAELLSETPGAIHWKAHFSIPLAKIGWDGNAESVRGGVFSILGKKENRTYWSAFLPRQQTPDFHLPQFFQSLVDL